VERAAIALPGRASCHGEDSDRLESVSRTMLMVAPWLYRNKRSPIELECGTVDLADLYRDLILAGTDPKGKGYWGPADDFNQRLVEMAAIGLNLYLSKDTLWNKLSASEKTQIAAWLQTAIGKKTYDVNWTLFNMFINLFLRKLNQNYSVEEIDRYLDRMDYWYSGDGWYRDGVHDCYDYYNSWVIQPYFLFWTWLDGQRRPELKPRVLHRAVRFLESYKYFFAANGAYPCFGRSMIYRFSAVSIFPVAQFLGISPIPPGQARRICSGNLKYFIENSALHKENYLQLGHLGEYPPIVEPYSGPASPYWAAKAFWCYLLADDDPFWTDREEPSEVEKKSFSIAVPSAGMLVRGHNPSGMVEIINQRSKHHVAKKYSNFSYSTHHGFEITQAGGTYCYDNSFCLTRDGAEFIQRTRPYHLITVKDFSASFQVLPDDDTVCVYTNIILKNDYQVRVHRAYGAEKFTAVEGGMSLGYEEGVSPEIRSGQDWEYASAGNLCTFIRNLSGYDEALPAAGHGGDPAGNNVLWPNSVVPGFKRTGPMSDKEVMAVMLAYDAVVLDPEEAAEKVRKFEVLDNGGVVITFDDGEAVFTQVGVPKPVTLELNGIDIAGDIICARAEPDGQSCHILMADGNRRNLHANQVNLLPED
ncbi:DUF2264 domain-containing protein, partial [Gemmatimonadota bacterium]